MFGNTLLERQLSDPSTLARQCGSLSLLWLHPAPLPKRRENPPGGWGKKDRNPSPWHPRLCFNCRQVSAGDSRSQPGPNLAKSMCFGENLHTPMHTHRDATASNLLRVVAWHQDYGCCGVSVPCGWQRGGGFRWGRYRWLTRPRACQGGPALLAHFGGRAGGR